MMKNQGRRIIVFDFEVTPSLWMVTFIDYHTKKQLTIINDAKKLKAFYEKAKNEIFVSYNGRTYDIPIFKSILLGLNPYRVSVELIENNKKAYQILPKEQKDIVFYHYDTSTGFHSLKQLEGFLGLSIEESEVDFSKEELTKADIAKLKEYNVYDVLATIEVFEQRKAEFNAFMDLIKMFDLPLEYLNKTKAQLGAIILGAKKPDKPRGDDWNLLFPNVLELGRYEFVKDWFLSDEAKINNSKLKIDVYETETIIGWGGIHSAKKNIKRKGKIVNFDINSMYPQTMICWDTLSRNISSPEKFVEIRDLRLHYKKTKNKGLDYALKILINSVFGASGDKYNDLYDERNKKLTCMYGQLFILDLLDKLESTLGNKIECLQLNTDGIMFMAESDEDIAIMENVINEWSERSKYTMERDDITDLIQKDVNNYCIKIISNGKEKIKAKGAMVKENSSLDNDLPILNIALRDYFINNIPVEKTINECNELIKFQKIYKITSNYKHAIHNNKPLANKVNRVFASKDENDTAIYKLKKDKENADLFAGTPEHCFIDNGDIRNKTVPENLDKQWYIDLANKRIKMFTK